ncbi:RISC-loading complex subunit tarbp2 [Drosophila bipectinata]|uniref:RISC-loading complex subunit tarbp2 n=1 Tax=Drosophila bipectinata TaxID=42026 RepID=UPI0038B3D289
MDYKSAVSSLQEFCAKNKICPPTYEFIDGEEAGYVCKVTLMEIDAYGNGRSKRDAKHLAASNIILKVRKLPGASSLIKDMEDEENKPSQLVEELSNTNRDMLKELRDYCVRHEMPLPTIEIVQQCGTPNAPEFVACCKVASLTRYGKSDKKKDARQRAAIEMLAVISCGSEDLRADKMQVVSTKEKETTMNDAMDDLETERRKKFNTYRELTEAGSVENTGLRLCDRHNYFKSFYPVLKSAAWETINSNEEFASDKDKALQVMSALKIRPRITTVASTSIEPMLQIELDCDYDCVFLGLESKIYLQVINYFKDMLY